MLDRFRLNFRLRIDDDRQIHVQRGKVSPRFLRELADVLALFDIRRGAIECKGRGARMRLIFTDGFPQAGRQAVRNVWQPPSGPGGGGGMRAAG
ncbi:DUF3634 family protein [Salinisphaera japonica]|uniref:Uncharacterized protein n=1 Tax=Salinisphaera japonica YTM-1 TaxID=1209778 RepID=A0A423Q137_9GAMM|nr:DUF3634 family protein [Salinisphaera japonica]ROO31971.1 hypothetical protein SAJA_01755 [Salinisphaera japonica YTM-1]|tara:strand:- start:291 stop:572 length:282 start_codon:yes stop_codon:yes gene_type:complete